MDIVIRHIGARLIADGHSCFAAMDFVVIYRPVIRWGGWITGINTNAIVRGEITDDQVLHRYAGAVGQAVPATYD